MAETYIQPTQGRIHAEWVYSNLSRAYPLDDSTGGQPGTLPCRLLADAFILLYGDVSETETTLYISKIVHSSTEVVFYLSGNLAGSIVDFGPVVTVDRRSAIGTTEAFELGVDGIVVSGKLVIGDLDSCENIPPVIDLSESVGKLFPGCVRVAPKGLQGIEVDGVIYSGVVELVAGDGIELDVEGDGPSAVITISVPDYDVPDENKVITTDASLLKQAISAYGEPVRSINSYKPDSSGNIDIVADERSVTAVADGGSESDDNGIKMQLSVTEVDPIAGSDAGSGAVQVTITKPQECEVTTIIESLLAMLQQLNQRATTLDNSVTTIDTAQANLAARLTGLV